MAKITFIGTGYVGLVSGTCFAEIGHDVICVDKMPEKITNLKNGIIPIYEPGLSELVQNNIANNRLSFTTDLAEALHQSDFIFIAVGTPQNNEGKADLSQVFSCAEEISKNINDTKIIVTKSTVPVGTGAKIKELINNEKAIIASNPEFLREGSAIGDFMQPDRVIIGSESNETNAKISALYENINTEILQTSLETAELIKYAANAFLATKVAFINEIADLCEASGADITKISQGIGLDDRIGKKFLNPGPGIGGSCFPKDTSALTKIGQDFNSPQKIIEAVVTSNNDRKNNLIKKLKNYLNINSENKLNNKKIAILGVTFKANTDDLRDSPAINLINDLIAENTHIDLYDPQGLPNAEAIFGNKINYKNYDINNSKNYDAAVILTEWEEFKNINFLELKIPNIIDFRNLYNPEDFKNSDINYFSVGRK